MPFSIIYITNESESEAKKLASHLLEKKLVACANIFPITSAYWWQNAIQNDNEWVAIVKTPNANWEKVKKETEKIHPYDVPCIMRLNAEANEAYEQWIEDEVGEKQPQRHGNTERK